MPPEGLDAFLEALDSIRKVLYKITFQANKRRARMKQIIKLIVFLLVIVAILSPFQGQAFNSATHVYIAEKVATKVFPFTFDKIDLYYGSIAPDISSYASNWPNGFCETHYQFIKLPYTWWKPGQRAFVQGWQIHNELRLWGADSYAHGTCEYLGTCPLAKCTYEGYVPSKAGELADAFFYASGNTMLQDYPDLAHFAIEVAIDLLLIDNQDHNLGEKLLTAALFRSSEDINLLMKVFVGQPDGIGTNRDTLSSAESTFRNLVINYAAALSLPEPLRMGLLGELGVQIANGMGVTIDSATVQEVLRAAIDFCRSDYYGPVDDAIHGIINNKANLIK